MNTNRAITPIELEYTIPAYMVIPLEYGDTSGLSDQDEKEYQHLLDILIDDSLGAAYMLGYGEESFFSHSNDVNKLGCDCVTMVMTLI